MKGSGLKRKLRKANSLSHLYDVQLVGDKRTMAKITSLLQHVFNPILWQNWSISVRLLHPRCIKNNITTPLSKQLCDVFFCSWKLPFYYEQIYMQILYIFKSSLFVSFINLTILIIKKKVKHFSFIFNLPLLRILYIFLVFKILSMCISVCLHITLLLLNFPTVGQ